MNAIRISIFVVFVASKHGMLHSSHQDSPSVPRYNAGSSKNDAHELFASLVLALDVPPAEATSGVVLGKL
jgi:hypothetical protein